ncbi:ead/Ea22-like family protein [Salmonella enterica subsp. enterica serovar Amager]|nr:ead/Ea22-like family protein [Salmonella enterica subsp. enterica serovar Amager]
MTALNKQALREAAEKAGKDKWQAKKINGDFYVIRSGSYIKQCGITSYQPIAEIDHKPVRDFVAMVNPATTLALLDENLQLQRGKDAIEAVALALRDDMRQAREQLAAAERLIAELDQRLIEYAGIATREAHRVAELEARTVSIPEVRITVAESKRKNLTWRELGAYNEGADVAKETILAAIRSAGIKIKGE